VGEEGLGGGGGGIEGEDGVGVNRWGGEKGGEVRGGRRKSMVVERGGVEVREG